MSELREEVATAIAKVDGHKLGQMAPAIASLYYARADAAIALVRAETLEEAAKVADDADEHSCGDEATMARCIAAAIRALGKPPTG